MRREININLQRAEDRIIYALLLGFFVMLGIGGGTVAYLTKRQPTLLFAERWPDERTLARWEMEKLFWRVTRARPIAGECTYNFTKQEYCL